MVKANHARPRSSGCLDPRPPLLTLLSSMHAMLTWYMPSMYATGRAVSADRANSRRCSRRCCCSCAPRDREQRSNCTCIYHHDRSDIHCVCACMPRAATSCLQRVGVNDKVSRNGSHYRLPRMTTPRSISRLAKRDVKARCASRNDSKSIYLFYH